MKPRVLLGVSSVVAVVLGCGGSARTTFDSNAGGSEAGGSAGSAALAGASARGGAAPLAGSGGAVGGSAGEAGSAGDAGSAGTAPLLPGSWDAVARISITDSQPAGRCEQVKFTLNISADQRITVGRDGQMTVAEATPIDDGYLVASLGLPRSDGCEANSLDLKNLRLVGRDQDGDGRADRIAGSATGTSQFILGDVGFSNSIEVELTGDPDRTPPSFGAPASPFSPLDPPTFSASEPLDLSGTSLELVGTTKTPLSELVPSDGAAPKSAIRWGTGVIFPLSGTWQVSGKGRDLIGLELTPAGTLRSLDDPGIFGQDGFEGPLKASVQSGKPALVSGVGDVPAIEGIQSLLLEPGDSLTFHLRRAAAESKLHFSVRGFGSSSGSIYFGKNIRVGVIGSETVTQVYVNLPSQTGVSTNDPEHPWASPVIDVDTPLDASGSDVLVSFADFGCMGFCPPPPVLLIDRLELE